MIDPEILDNPDAGEVYLVIRAHFRYDGTAFPEAVCLKSNYDETLEKVNAQDDDTGARDAGDREYNFAGFVVSPESFPIGRLGR